MTKAPLRVRRGLASDASDDGRTVEATRALGVKSAPQDHASQCHLSGRMPHTQLATLLQACLIKTPVGEEQAGGRGGSRLLSAGAAPRPERSGAAGLQQRRRGDG